MKKIFKTFGLLLMFIVVGVLAGCTNTTQKVIVSIEKTSTIGNVDIYTITYSDNTTTTMEVSNGQKTIIGIKKTSSVGKTDIYTITYSDNTTETFTITNGQDGKDAEPITINDLYEKWKESLNEGEDDSFDTFLKNYITIDDSSNLYNVSKAITSVVTINTVFNYKQSSLFGNVSESQKMSAGSGVIIDMSEEDKNNGNCYIITNYHVVYDSTCVDKNGISQDIRAYLYGMDGMTSNMIKAEYVGGSMSHDIAVLKVTGSEILKNSLATQCKISDKEMIVGQNVLAIGNPEGEGISVTKGICSVESEQITMTLADEKTEGNMRLMRIDAPVNPGNSGGGLFNEKCELVGIVNAKIVDSEIDCIGYAIPIDTAKLVYDRIVSTCDGDSITEPKFAKLGLNVLSYGYENYFSSETQTIKTRQYMVIDSIAGGISQSLGDSGFKRKDIIVSAEYNGKVYTFERMYQLSNLLLSLDEDASVDFTVKRVVIPEDNNKDNEGYIDIDSDTTYVYPNATYEEVKISLKYSSKYFS